MFLLVRYQVSLSLGVCFTGALLFRKAEAVGMSILSYTELPIIPTQVRVPRMITGRGVRWVILTSYLFMSQLHGVSSKAGEHRVKYSHRRE